MERLEHISQILLSPIKMGGITLLPEEEIHALKEMRKKMGARTL